MKPNKTGACRANSLPADGSGGTRKKRRVRVSFSSLPPTEFEVERVTGDKEDKEETGPRSGHLRSYKARKKSVKKSTVFEYDMDAADRNIEPKLICENPSRDQHANNNNNKIDNVNEMLMDFLEEIEAENVTVENCLRDAITLGVLDVSQAQQVIPCFAQDSIPKFRNDSIKVLENADWSKESEDKEESSSTTVIEKLLDVFSTMGGNDLSKCCKMTLGKLCQLTSYEEYQNTQILEQRLRSRPYSCTPGTRARRLSEDSLNASESMDETSSTEVSCLSSESSDTFDHDPCTGLSQEHCRITDSDSKPQDIKQVLPALMDQGVLNPRQVWKILESTDPNEAYKKLMKELSNSTSIDGLVSQLTEANVSDNAIYKWNAQNQAHCLPKQTSTFIENPSSLPRMEHWRLPSIMTSTPRRRASSVFYRSSEDDDSNCDSSLKADDDFLEYWSEVNNLPPSIAGVLRNHGLTAEDQLANIKEKDLEDLSELSWPRRAQLWVAVEGLRLDQAYSKAHQKLSNSVKILNLLV